MNGRRVVTIVVGLVALAVLGAPWMLVEAQTDEQINADKQVDAPVLSLAQIHLHIPMILKSIDQASQAVGAGQKEKALSALDKAQKMLIAVHQALGSHLKPVFVNNRCPIMDKAIKLDKVAKNLIREHKGQKVAFCCAGCLGPWDELTDAQKDAKLRKVLIAAPVWTCSMHPQIRAAEPGACPICNMKLIQASEAGRARNAQSDGHADQAH